MFDPMMISEKLVSYVASKKLIVIYGGIGELQRSASRKALLTA